MQTVFFWMGTLHCICWHFGVCHHHDRCLKPELANFIGRNSPWHNYRYTREYKRAPVVHIRRHLFVYVWRRILRESTLPSISGIVCLRVRDTWHLDTRLVRYLHGREACTFSSWESWMHLLCEFLHEETPFAPVPIFEGCKAGVCTPWLGTCDG